MSRIPTTFEAVPLPLKSVPRAQPRSWGRHWLSVTIALLGVYAVVPLLAPAFMRVGWVGPAEAIYAFYSTQCHQLPQRSLFFFGERASYSLSEIQAASQSSLDPLVLRRFVGDAAMGWKVAWSDRMTSMYLSLLLFTILYRPLLRRLRVRWWLFALLILPLAADGVSHAVSDLAGIGAGFRDSNAWLAALTGNSLPASFYAGDALGSFNSILRWLSGLLFGLGVAGLVLPQLEAAFQDHPADGAGIRGG
jgi:uncharacterized membrane protein